MAAADYITEYLKEHPGFLQLSRVYKTNLHTYTAPVYEMADEALEKHSNKAAWAFTKYVAVHAGDAPVLRTQHEGALVAMDTIEFAMAKHRRQQQRLHQESVNAAKNNRRVEIVEKHPRTLLMLIEPMRAVARTTPTKPAAAASRKQQQVPVNLDLGKHNVLREVIRNMPIPDLIKCDSREKKYYIEKDKLKQLIESHPELKQHFPKLERMTKVQMCEILRRLASATP